MRGSDIDDAAKSGTRCRPMRVIVLDGAAPRAEMLGLLLMAAGYRCMSTTSADAALEAVREHPPDVAVIDIDLPRSRGQELAEQIRMMVGTVRLIATSAREEVLDGVLVSGCVFDAVVLKPIAINELLSEMDLARDAREAAAGEG